MKSCFLNALIVDCVRPESNLMHPLTRANKHLAFHVVSNVQICHTRYKNNSAKHTETVWVTQSLRALSFTTINRKIRKFFMVSVDICLRCLSAGNQTPVLKYHRYMIKSILHYITLVSLFLTHFHTSTSAQVRTNDLLSTPFFFSHAIRWPPHCVPLSPAAISWYFL